MAEIVPLAEVRRIPNSVVTVGTFDGIHTGHRVLIDRVLQRASERGGRSVVVTFDPHPRSIIHPGSDGIKLLTTLQERAELLAEIGIDQMVVIPFNRDFSLLGSREFVRDIIWKEIGVSDLVIGYDHQFGKNREGTIETARRIAGELGFRVDVVSKQEYGERTISSSAIRKSIQQEGDMALAARLLGRPYLLSGTVVHGDGRGKQIGYPTANVQPEHPDKVVPKTGVYAVRADTVYGSYAGMMNIGFRPTFRGKTETLEVHLVDFDEDLYGSRVGIRFIGRLRDEMKFENAETLKRQLDKDKHDSLLLLKRENALP